MATKKKFVTTFQFEGTTKGGKVRLGDDSDRKDNQFVGALYLPKGSEEGNYKVTVELIED